MTGLYTTIDELKVALETAEIELKAESEKVADAVERRDVAHNRVQALRRAIEGLADLGAILKGEKPTAIPF